jgi:uncharacterized protein
MVLVFVDTTTDIDDPDRARGRRRRRGPRPSTTPPTSRSRRSASRCCSATQDDFLGEVAELFTLAFADHRRGAAVRVLGQPDGHDEPVWRRPAACSPTPPSTMLTIVLVVLWMNGVGALLQRVGLLGPLTEVAQIVPILLVGLGVDYGIHLTSRYRDEVGAGRTVDAAMRTAIGTVGVALVLRHVTTAIGFLTNVVNPIPALRDFGILASVGITLSFVLMLTFVPALRIVLDRRAEAGPPADRRHGRDPRPAAAGARGPRPRCWPSGRRSRRWSSRSCSGGLGYLGLSNISTEFSFTDFLPEDSPVVQTLDTIEEEFGGGFGETTQVLVEDADLDRPGGVQRLGDAAGSSPTPRTC